MMNRTEMLTNLITEHLTHNRYMDVHTFRETFVTGLPGKLALLAISRDGEKILPVFDQTFYPTTEKIDYNMVRQVLGNDWTPVITAHVWHRYPGYVPQTLLATDGIVDEKVLHRIFGNRVNWHHNVLGMVNAFNFGDFDIKTLPLLALYTVDIEGARRIRILNDADEGKVYGYDMDVNGYIRYMDRETGRTIFAQIEIGRDNLDWLHWPTH
jgi:hypothetical protein